MLHVTTTVVIDKHHAYILKNKAAEAGISMKLMLETVLQQTWPETFKIADSKLEDRRARFASKSLTTDPDEHMTTINSL